MLGMLAVKVLPKSGEPAGTARRLGARIFSTAQSGVNLRTGTQWRCAMWRLTDLQALIFMTLIVVTVACAVATMGGHSRQPLLEALCELNALGLLDVLRYPKRCVCAMSERWRDVVSRHDAVDISREELLYRCRVRANPR
jgi:hypothetical protein